MDVMLGVGAVRWTMPSMVERMEVVELARRGESARASVRALVAGLPQGVLADLGLAARPAGAVDDFMEAALKRQGCTVRHITDAYHMAFVEVVNWYNEATAVEEARGNSVAPAGADESGGDPTPTTPPASEASAAPSSP